MILSARSLRLARRKPAPSERACNAAFVAHGLHEHRRACRSYTGEAGSWAVSLLNEMLQEIAIVRTTRGATLAGVWMQISTAIAAA